ncbi:50S ribosomal protein L21 [Candidatus Mikella endobia]|uniref:Large ribosomal subunit protein bL21 n=1 Tax=Candidatus Mikella endobia TaxID=1778264 RepID=A0A143WPQ7_9ENTR|nr:50S ribosomal protein L21 [Candidatus Mikella endobia]CUX95776.1 50S ribosomal protein L21 [Candidatus Mikella endobia]
MYAVFQTGGKQHRVIKNQIIKIEKLNISINNIIEFTKISMINDNNHLYVGHPFIENCKITAQIVAHKQSDKIKIIKFNRRKHFRKHMGHRQLFTSIKILDIIINS